MENDVGLGFAERRVDLVFVRDIYLVILDRGKSIVLSLHIKDRYRRRWLKLEKLLDESMAKMAAASDHESGFDVLSAAVHGDLKRCNALGE